MACHQTRTVVRELDNSFLGDKTFYAYQPAYGDESHGDSYSKVFIEYGRTDGRVFNNSDMTFVYGERWGTLYNQTLMNLTMKNNVIAKASQTNIGTYVVETTGNEENNAFNFEWNEDDPTESVAGVTIIIQNYAADGSDLGTHYPFYGTSEYPYNVSGYEFDPIAPISIRPTGDVLVLADFEVALMTTARLPWITIRNDEAK